MLDARIKFTEKYVEDGMTTLYFIAPKELLAGKYPDAESLAISVEFPDGKPEAQHATVEIAPMNDGECYGWRDADIPYDEIEALFVLAEKSLNQDKAPLEQQVALAEEKAAKDSKYVQVALSKDELDLIKKSLDAFGDRMADTVGYSSGEKCWDLKEKLEAIEANHDREVER